MNRRRRVVAFGKPIIIGLPAPLIPIPSRVPSAVILLTEPRI